MTNPEKPVLMTTVGGSMTTYNFNNPNFMVLDLDAATMVPTNMHTFYIDVKEANAMGAPDWRELHDYKESYSMPDLSPSSFKDLAVRIFTDKELATEFQANEHRRNPYASQEVNQLHIYCQLVTSEAHENHECNQTGGLSAYGTDYKFLSKDLPGAIVDWIIGDWIDATITQQ